MAWLLVDGLALRSMLLNQFSKFITRSMTKAVSLRLCRATLCLLLVITSLQSLFMKAAKSCLFQSSSFSVPFFFFKTIILGKPDVKLKCTLFVGWLQQFLLALQPLSSLHITFGLCAYTDVKLCKQNYLCSTAVNRESVVRDVSVTDNWAVAAIHQ